MNYEDICIDEDDKEQIEFVRRFLTSFRRNNYDEYSVVSRFEFQAFSNVIMLLAEKLREAKK
jgi:hypothetical protein